MTAASHKLCHLPLEPSVVAAFNRRGIVSTSEIHELGDATNLATELKCSPRHAQELLQQVDAALSEVQGGDNMVTASSLLSRLKKKEFSKRNIITFCKSIDILLGGGIALGQVTELVGLPGVGKTQFAMQLCVDTRLPRQQGGVQGEVVYIDAEGSFSAERCHVMAEALTSHVRNKTRQRSSVPSWFQTEAILNGIHVFRVFNQDAQTATIKSLEAFLQNRADRKCPVRLIVIDSIAFHYRGSHDDYMARTRSLTSIAGFLTRLAVKFDVAIVTVNQMTTKVDSTSSSTNSSRVVPALGASWAHNCTNRIMLSRVDGEPSTSSARQCHLLNSPYKPIGNAYCTVGEFGIRDIRQKPALLARHTDSAAKRPRTQY